MTEANGDYTDYGYDNVYELTSEVMKDSGGTTIYSISWTYDNVGNRATQNKDGTQTSYTYNNMNQMTAAGNITFTYDSNGNTASKTESQATTNYTWNYQNALTKIDNPSGDDYVYEYEGEGMRVRAGHDSGQGNVWDTRFYYDVGVSPYAYLFDSDDAKNMTVAYTTDSYGGLVSQRRSGSTYYHLYDRLGSTRKLLDSSQAVTDSYSYYAFGEVRSSSGSTTNPFKFVGQLGYYDDPATEFQYLRARYYGPACGRFESAEPLPTQGRRDATAHPYLYGGQEPTVYVDPAGEWCTTMWYSSHRTRKVRGHKSDWRLVVSESDTNVGWSDHYEADVCQIRCHWYGSYEEWGVDERCWTAHILCYCRGHFTWRNPAGCARRPYRFKHKIDHTYTAEVPIGYVSAADCMDVQYMCWSFGLPPFLP